MEKPLSGNGNKVNFQLPNVNTRQVTCREESAQAVYVKHCYPEVFKQKSDFYDYLPKISQLPGAEVEETYGLMYHKPETDAEIKMHDLWVARRRQESFEWKSQQQLSLVLDRLSLHKSRLESDLLRRHESGAYLRGEDTRPKSANAKPTNGIANRFASSTETSRCKSKLLSARSAARGVSAGAILTGHPTQIKSGTEYDSDYMLPKDDIYEDTGEDLASDELYSDSNRVKSRVVVKIMKNGIETEQVLNQSVRKSVQKNIKAATIGTVPMRYRTPIPLTYSHEHYMELSDSEDERERDGEEGGVGSAHLHRGKSQGNRLFINTAPQLGTRDPGLIVGGKRPKAAVPAGGVRVQFKRDRVVNRERPISASLFRTLADCDPEFKVLYRYTNYRRMPLSESQDAWLDTQEKGRLKSSMEYAKKLVEEQTIRAAKKKDKEKGKGKKENDKSTKLNGASRTINSTTLQRDSLKSKYKDASDFMEKNFPNYERDDFRDEDRVESACPMRATQNHESDRVLGAFAKFNLPIRESVVRNALLVPHDYPEAICLEQMRTSSLEGLMLNPIRKDLWRSYTRKLAKKGGKKRRANK